MTYRDHEIEARIIERLSELGAQRHHKAVPIRDQAAELRRVEAFVQREQNLPKNDHPRESHRDLMSRARRLGDIGNSISE